MIKQFLIFLICTASILTGCSTTGTAAKDPSASSEPEAYRKAEFPEWLNDVRRAEIIFAGSIPFTILMTNIGYGLYGTVADGLGEGYSIENLTQPAAMTTEDRYNILKISLGISGVISLADFIIGLFEEPDIVE